MQDQDELNSHLLLSILNRSNKSQFNLKYEEENLKDLSGPKLPSDWKLNNNKRGHSTFNRIKKNEKLYNRNIQSSYIQ